MHCEHYLDNSATTPVLPQAAEEALRLMTQCWGNPSSLHTKGFLAKKELDSARETIARRLGAAPEEIFFTSGGTEANNLALLGAAGARRPMGDKIVVTAIEHDSVLNPAKELERRGFQVQYLSPGPNGVVPAQALADAIDEKTILVSGRRPRPSGERARPLFSIPTVSKPSVSWISPPKSWARTCAR